MGQNKVFFSTFFSKNRLLVVFMISILFISGFLYINLEYKYFDFEKNMPQYIAHAGGQINGIFYSNSLNALESNYQKGYRFFELDFNWTKDNKLVLIHDWDETFNELFEVKPIKVTYVEFMNLTMVNSLIQLDVNSLIDWLSEHNDVMIITDVKENNIEALRILKSKITSEKNFFIPQVYSFSEYEKAKSMGYENIIITLYRSVYTDDEIISFVNRNKVWAITIPMMKAFTFLPRNLSKNGIPVYAHTINNPLLYKILQYNCVLGIYTDTLICNE